jgi:hypothetical protein
MRLPHQTVPAARARESLATHAGGTAAREHPRLLGRGAACTARARCALQTTDGAAADAATPSAARRGCRWFACECLHAFLLRTISLAIRCDTVLGRLHCVADTRKWACLLSVAVIQCRLGATSSLRLLCADVLCMVAAHVKASPRQWIEFTVGLDKLTQLVRA